MFVLDALHRLEDGGSVVMLLPHGVLFRGSAEYQIRRKLIDENYIDAIIGLPDKLFTATQIPTVILILKKNRKASDILIVDASKQYEKLGKINSERCHSMSLSSVVL